MAAKAPDEGAAWAWVRPVYERFVEEEKRAIKSAVRSMRAAQDAAVDARRQALEGVRSAAAAAERQSTEAANAGTGALISGTKAFPEAAVGAAAVGFNLANGFAPRRTVLVVVAAAFALRGPLANKFGDTVAAWSASLSEAVRSRAAAAGMLPPTPTPTPATEPVPEVTEQSL